MIFLAPGIKNCVYLTDLSVGEGWIEDKTWSLAGS